MSDQIEEADEYLEPGFDAESDDDRPDDPGDLPATTEVNPVKIYPTRKKFHSVKLRFASDANPDHALREEAQLFCDVRVAKLKAASSSRVRLSIRTFIDAIEASGLALASLPHDFLATYWVPVQPGRDVVTLSIKLSIIKEFLGWLRDRQMFVADLADPPVDRAKLAELALAKRTAKAMANRTEKQRKRREEYRSVMNAMNEQVTPMSTQSAEPGLAMPDASAPRLPAIPAPNEVPRGPRASGRNPLPGWLPSGYKIRVWKEGPPGEEDIHVKDWRTEPVLRYGSIEAFLEEVVRPTYGPFPGQGDRTYLVALLNPAGAVGERARYPVAAAEGVPSPMPGVQQVAPAIGGTPGVSADAGGAYAVFDQVRAAEDRLRQQMQSVLVEHEQRQRVAGVPLPLDPSVATLQAQAAQLSEQLQELRRLMSQQAPAAPQTQPSVPVINDTRPLIDLLTQVVTKQQTAPQPPPMQPSGNPMLDAIQVMSSMQANTFALMERLRPPAPETNTAQMFKEALKEVTDRFEEKLEDLEERVAVPPKSDLQDFFDKLAFFRTMTGADPNVPWLRQKESDTFIGMLGDVLKEFTRNAPTILDKYRSVVETVGAVQHGITPPSVQQPAQLPAAPEQYAPPPAPPRAEVPPAPPKLTPEQMAAQVSAKRRAALPVGVRTALDALFSATNDNSVGMALQELVSAFQQVAQQEEVAIAEMKRQGRPVPPSQTAQVLQRVEFFVREGAKAHIKSDPRAPQIDAEMVNQMRQIMVFVGYAELATQSRLSEIVGALRRLQLAEPGMWVEDAENLAHETASDEVDDGADDEEFSDDEEGLGNEPVAENVATSA